MEKVISKKEGALNWHPDGSFHFTQGSRPLWTAEARKIPLNKNEDRRHGLHGAEVITKAAETFINNELKKSGVEKTRKKLYVNLKSRKVPVKTFEKEKLAGLINTFRRYAFSKVSNLLPGDSDYNRAIESVRKKVIGVKKRLHLRFFSHGETPDEIAVEPYKSYALSQLRRTETQQGRSRRKQIIDDITLNVIRPTLTHCSDIIGVDQALTLFMDSTKIDIGFSSTNCFKKYNKRILDLDTRIKRGFVEEEGLTQEIFNKLIGYRPRKKK